MMLKGAWRMQVPADTSPAEALATLVAWVAALPSPLLPASAARVAEQGSASPVAAEELLADVLSPPAWATLRLMLREALSALCQQLCSGTLVGLQASGLQCRTLSVAWAP